MPRLQLMPVCLAVYVSGITCCRGPRTLDALSTTQVVLQLPAVVTTCGAKPLRAAASLA
jgi:hypothetical protein